MSMWRKNAFFLEEVHDTGSSNGLPLYTPCSLKAGMTYMARATAAYSQTELLAVALQWDARCQTVRPPELTHPEAPKDKGRTAAMTAIDVLISRSPVRGQPHSGWDRDQADAAEAGGS